MIRSAVCVSGASRGATHNTIVALPTHIWARHLVSISSKFLASPSFRNNLVVNLNQGVVLNVNGTITPYHIEVRNNLYWAPNSADLFLTSTGGKYTTLAAWQTATGLCKGAILADPVFTDTNNLPAG